MTLLAVRQYVRNCTAGLLVGIIAVDPSLAAQGQLVTPADLQKEMTSATRMRQQNRETIVNFLNSAPAKKVIGTTAQLERVKVAIASLDDQELARLAARAEKAQADFAAGRISDRDLLLILVGLAALILIIVAVD